MLFFLFLCPRSHRQRWQPGSPTCKKHQPLKSLLGCYVSATTHQSAWLMNMQKESAALPSRERMKIEKKDKRKKKNTMRCCRPVKTDHKYLINTNYLKKEQPFWPITGRLLLKGWEKITLPFQAWRPKALKSVLCGEASIMFPSTFMSGMKGPKCSLSESPPPSPQPPAPAPTAGGASMHQYHLHPLEDVWQAGPWGFCYCCYCFCLHPLTLASPSLTGATPPPSVLTAEEETSVWDTTNLWKGSCWRKLLVYGGWSLLFLATRLATVVAWRFPQSPHSRKLVDPLPQWEQQFLCWN